MIGDFYVIFGNFWWHFWWFFGWDLGTPAILRQNPNKLSFGQFWKKVGIGSDPRPPPWAKFPTFTENLFLGLPLLKPGPFDWNILAKCDLSCENLVPRPKYLGPSSSNIQYLTRPDQKLSKNIYFIGSEWYISLYVLGKSCSVSHLQQLNLGQNYLTKIGVRPDKTSHKLLLGPKILA